MRDSSARGSNPAANADAAVGAAVRFLFRQFS
jgi:hypothetical protein